MKKPNKFLFFIVIATIIIWYIIKNKTNPTSISTSSSITSSKTGTTISTTSGGNTATSTAVAKVTSDASFPLDLDKNLKSSGFTSVSKFTSDSSYDAPLVNSTIDTGSYDNGLKLSTIDTGYSSYDSEITTQNYNTLPKGFVSLTKYPDGSDVKISNSIMSVYPDGVTVVPIEQQIGTMVIINRTDITKMNTFGTIYQSINSAEEASSILSNLSQTNIDAYAFFGVYAVTMLLAFGSELVNQLTYCNNNKNNERCMDSMKSVYITDYMLNVNLLNGTPNTGNGWNHYTIPTLTLNRDSNVSPSLITPLINYSTRQIKNIILKYRGKESNNTGTPSQLTINVNGESFKRDTAFFDNPGSYNYNIFCPPVKYPLVVSVFTISLSCPGTSVSVDDLQLLFVYL
jgi:hypothetical protein